MVTTQVDRLKNVGTVPRTVRNAARLGNAPYRIV